MQEFDITGVLSEDCDHIEIYHWKMLSRVLKNLVGKKLSIKIKIYRESKSLKQVGYMFSCVVPTVQAWLKETTGHYITKDEAYIWLKLKFNDEKPEVIHILGEEVIRFKTKSPSAMNTQEFAEFTDKILKGMAELGCYIDDPVGNNELHELIKANRDKRHEQNL